MYVYDTYEGNTADESLAARLESESHETVTVDDDQRRRSRFRTETDAETEIGVVVGRELRAGDVLSTGDGTGPLVEVALEPVEALVVDFGDAEPAMTAAVALGHAAGNRHWDVAIRDQRVLFPASESDERLRATVDPHLPDGTTVGRERVSPAVFDGGSVGHGEDRHGHSHGGGEHGHEGDGHGRDHRHAGHSHDGHDHEGTHAHEHSHAGEGGGDGS